MSPASPDRLPERVAPPDADRILAAEYVLGTLDAEDRRRVRARCAAEPQFAALVRLWERRLAPLHELAVPVIPAPDIWRAIASDLRSAPPALRGATLPRGLSPSPDPPRRPAMPEGRLARMAEPAGEGAVSRVRRLFGLHPGRRQEAGRGENGRSEAGRGEAEHGAARPVRRRAFPPLDPATAPPDLAEPGGRRQSGAVRDPWPSALVPQPDPHRPPQSPQRIAEPPAVRAEILPAAARQLDGSPALKLVPPPPRPRPAPEPLTPPPAFIFLEPDPPPEPEPAAPGGPEAPAETTDPAPGHPADAGAGTDAAAVPAGLGAADAPPPEPVLPEPVAPEPAAPASAASAPAASETAAFRPAAPGTVPVAPDPIVIASAEAAPADAAAPVPAPAPGCAPAAPQATGDEPQAPAGSVAPAAGLVAGASGPVPEAGAATVVAPAVETPGPASPPAGTVASGTVPADETAAPVSGPEVAEAAALSASPEAGAGETPSADPAAGEKSAEAPLPGWAAEVASGEVSALPEETPIQARTIVRHGPWRGIALVVALLGLGLGGLAAYREWIWPGEGYWVAVLQPEPLPAVSARIDPDSGVLHVRSFAPAPAEGEIYRLWLVPLGGAPRLVGAFSAGLSERLPELARLGRRGLAGAEMLVTREPTDRSDIATGPGGSVVYRGRLVPE